PMKAKAFRQTSQLTGRGITVAVLDGEVNASLPNLFQNRVTRKNNYTDEAWGTPVRHATAVAGIIGADGPDLTGIAPDAAIWSYKIFKAVDAPDFSGALALQNALE